MPEPATAPPKELANTAGFQVEPNLPSKRRRAKRNPFRPDPPRSPAPKFRTPDKSPLKKPAAKKGIETRGRVASGRITKNKKASSQVKVLTNKSRTVTRTSSKKMQTPSNATEISSYDDYPIEEGLVEISQFTPWNSRGRTIEVDAQHVLEIEKEAGVSLELVRTMIIDSAQVLYDRGGDFKIITTYELGCFTAFLVQNTTEAEPSFIYKICAHNSFGIKNAFAQLLAATQIMLNKKAKHGDETFKIVNIS